jgi:hypothetical protein
MVMYRIASSVCLLGLVVGIFLIAFHETVSAFTGKEFVIKLGSLQSYPVNGTAHFQIKASVNYSVSDSKFVGQRINAVMKVHSSNGSVIKTTSFPNGFIANKTDTARLLTNIPIALAKNITTETFFTDLNRANILSNTLKAQPTISGSIKSSGSTANIK